jgi:hypothetical protein
MLVQEAGVGMMILTVGVVLTTAGDVAGAGAQAVRNSKSNKLMERSFRIGFPESDPHTLFVLRPGGSESLFLDRCF